MSKREPSRYSAKRARAMARRVRRRMPTVSLKDVSLRGPTLVAVSSPRKQEAEVLRVLVLKMVRRRVLFDASHVENPGGARDSVRDMLLDIELARLALPPGSLYDDLLGSLQAAANTFRTEVDRLERERRPGAPLFPWGEILYNLRLGTYEFAMAVRDGFPELGAASELEGRIDLESARYGPIGEESKTVLIIPTNLPVTSARDREQGAESFPRDSNPESDAGYT